MTDQLERFQGWLTSGERSSRRRFLIRIGRASVGFVAGLTGLANPLKAMAYSVFCCNLIYPAPLCSFTSCAGNCLDCYEWTCCYNNGPRRYRCGECLTDSCSFYQYLGSNCPTVPVRVAS